MTNLIDLQNIPRLIEDEDGDTKATVGVPSIIEWHKDGHHCLCFWDGRTWHDYGVDSDGNLCAQHDFWADLLATPLVAE